MKHKLQNARVVARNKAEIEFFLNKHKVRRATIHECDTSPTGYLVDVDSHVCIANNKIQYIPVDFGDVRDFFNCSENSLVSLEGSPKRCEMFSCSQNNLTNLKHAPVYVKLSFLASNNRLDCLTDLPSTMKQDVFLSHNALASLDDFPWTLSPQNLRLNHNQISSLQGMGRKVKSLDLSHNCLKSLEGLSHVELHAMNVSFNPLESWVGLPLKLRKQLHITSQNYPGIQSIAVGGIEWEQMVLQSQIEEVSAPRQKKHHKI